MKKSYFLIEKLSTSKLSLLVLFFSIFLGQKISAQVDVTATAGTLNSSYTTLNAAFTAVNSGTHQGVISISITGDTNEGATTAVLNANGAVSSITISPSGGVTRTISGATTAGTPMIDLNGADNVTFDGINSGGNKLIIANTTVSATSGTSTIRFIGGATNNIITNCSVQGSSTMSVVTNGGNIYFATDAVTASGNDNNTISNCDIGPVGTNFPTKAIYSNGSTTTTLIGNSGNSITNNDIHDFFGAAVTSSGISLQGGSNTWSITNNRVYQTTLKTWTTGATHRGIEISNTTATSGNQGHTITGNIIGFSSNTQTGVYALTGSTGKFQGIVFNGITGGTISNINNNTVASVSLTGVTSSGTSTSSPFMGIMIVNGLANSNNNTLGSQVATNSLVFSTTTTTGTEVYGMFNFSVDNWNVGNNNIGGINITNLGASGTFVFYGIRVNTGTTNTMTATNNNIGGMVANSIQLTATGASSQMVGLVTVNAGTTATSNIVRNLTTNIGTGTGTTASVIGMSSTTTTPSHNFSQNTIYNLRNTNTTAASTVTGIQFTGAGANSVQRNLIYDLIVDSNSATAEVTGIRVAGGTTQYANNIIRIGNSIVNAVQINGINEVGGTDNYYHNSIYIGGAPTAGTANSFAFNSTVTTNARSFRDNIFFNARNNSGATGKNYIVRVGGTAPNPAGLTINNNVYFANGTGSVFGLFNALDVADLTSWKTAVGQDVNSFIADPQFNNPTGVIPDLHLHPTNPTIAEGNGFDVGITLDYDGETRSGLTPTDIGADAGNYVGQDLSGPAITYSVLPFICSTGDRSLTGVVITDNTGVPTVGAFQPRAYYRKNAGTWFSSQGTLASGTSTNGTWNFSIIAADMGGLVLGDNVQYYVIAQDLAGTPNITSMPIGVVATDVNTVTTHPVIPNNYNITSTLAGTYTVGLTGNYTTITAAVNAYNTSCLTGAVVFELLDTTYPSETFPITINQNPNSSAINTLTIKPSTGVTTTISGSNAAAIVKLNGADYVTIDGSNNGTDSKDLSITNTNTGTASAVVWNGSASASDSASNITIKNLNILGNAPLTTFVGIFSGSGTTMGAIAESANNNFVVQNNSIAKTQYGIAITGASTLNTGNIISNNNIGSNTATDYIGFIGVFTSNNNGILIRNNSIFNIITTANNPMGMNIAANVINSTIDSNNISGVAYTGTGGYGGKGINVNTANTTSNLTISNNMVSNIRGDGWSSLASTDIVVGLRIVGTTGGVNVYHNTINLGSGTFAGNASGTFSAAFHIASTVTSLNVRNNIFGSNLFNSVAAGAKTYAIACEAPNTIFTNIDNNNYFVGGTQGVLGFLTSDRTNLAGIVAGFGQNVASLNVTPVFVSATDLHLVTTTNTAIDNKGTTIASVTLDIDGNVRNVTTPDMGADEFTSTACTLANGGTISALVNTFCDSGSTTISSSGYSTGFSTTYQWQSSADLAFTTPINEGVALTTYADLVTPTITATTYYRLAVTCVENGQANFSNIVSVTITPSSSLPNEVVSVCDTYTWAANGTTYTTSGTYTSVTNCVTRTLDLTITPSSSLPTEVVSACDTYTWSANGATYTTSGIYTSTTACVTRTLDLTITPSSSLPTEVVSVCDTYTWTANGTTYTTSGIYTSTTACVTRTLDLTITPSSSLPTEVVSACDTYTWSANGTTYTTSGIYTNVVNCVTRTLDLTINLSTTTTTNVTVCDSYTWAENGTTYTVSGTYTNVTTNGAGYPNTATLNLIVTNASIDFANLQFPASASICEGGTMTAYGQVYEPGFTEAAGQAAGIDVEFGYNSANTNPNTWSTWTPATFNVQVGNNDEYMFTTSNALVGGTYYYTFRYRLSGCSTWQYGGDNNGFWNGTTQNSGVLTITAATISGATTQVINGGVAADVTIEDIVVTSNGTVTWFASSADAASNINPLAVGTQLVDGNTYYGVTNIGTCRSTTLAVTVTVVLGNTSFDLSQLNYYPNPVKDIFNVKYNKEIISVDVYDLTGRKVIEMKPNTLEVQLNMTNLSNAMYIVRLQSVDGITELKVYKN